MSGILHERARTHPGAQRWALAAVVCAGTLLAVSVTLLIADDVRARMRAAAEAPRLADLEERAGSELEAALALNDVRLAEADRSLARRELRGWLVPLIAGSAAAWVLAAKWRAALRGWRPPARETLVELRLASSSDVPPAGWPGHRADRPTEVDPEDVEAILAATGRSAEAAVPILNAVQARWGYLPDEALRLVCEHTAIAPAQLAGNSTFYANFRRSPVGRHVLRVCHGTACHVAGSQRIEDELRRRLEIPDGADTDPGLAFTVDRVACLGCCSLAPVLVIDERTAGRLTPESACRAVAPLQEVEA